MSPLLPQAVRWETLAPAERRQLLRRPAQSTAVAVEQAVREIIARVRSAGDRAVLELCLELDHVTLSSLQVSEEELEASAGALTAEQRQAVNRAITNVRAFHEAQRPVAIRVNTMPGVTCERMSVPLDAVGLYVPAGSAPLPSSALMLAVPAMLAGCRRVILCSPPRHDGRLDPGVLFTARQCGVTEIYKAGGAQAIAAMAYGTESIPKVDKIFGPGNTWVTAAKVLVAADPEGAAYDMPAGPSEVMVVADDSADPDFVASDLLAQAEHSPDAQAVLVATSPGLIPAVAQALGRQLPKLSRASVAGAALANSRLIQVDGLATAMEVANHYAPEHLILQVREPRRWLSAVRTAGSVFLGAWTPEALGDYCSGTNHVLPTYGYARAHSGLSLGAFMREMTIQQLTEEGLLDLGPTAVTLAMMEGLDAHAASVSARLAKLARGRP